MNDDLISRKALLEEFDRVCVDGVMAHGANVNLEIEFVRAVQKAPSIDPHKHGRWIIGEMGVFGCPIHCSECGWGSDCADRDKWMHYPGHKFCGACGARMDGGEEQ